MSVSSAIRLFPSIASFVEGSGWRRDAAVGSPADALLAAASRPLGRWQWWTGASLDPASRLTRLLATYREAMDAEVGGRITRADFFWRRVLDQLPQVVEREQWRTIARNVCGGNLTDDEIGNLRTCFVSEVFLDAFTAFYAAYARSQDRRPRAFVHSAHIGSILHIESAAAEHARKTFAPMLEAEIERAGQAKDWRRVLHAARTAIAYFPGEIKYEDSVAYAIHAQATDRLSKFNDERASHSNAAVLLDAINDIHAFTQQCPGNSTGFNVTASLLHMRAVQLANSGSFSQALLDAEKASLYNPQEKNIDETRAQLSELMQERLKGVREMMDELSRRPNAQLNAQGQMLLADAKSGYGPYNQFVESDHPRRITSAAAYARASSLFRRIGLAIPEHEELYAAEGELGNGLVEVLASPPESAAGIAGAWSAVVNVQPELQKYPADLIHRYLERRLFPQEQQSEPPPAPEITLQPARSSVEPLGPWLFSRNAPIAKLLMAAAVVALMWASILTTATWQRRAARNAAFAKIEAAVAAKDDPRTIAAAEEYFKTETLPEGDATREAHALSHYREAIARSFIRKPGAPDANDLEMLRRYRTATRHLQVAEVQQ